MLDPAATKGLKTRVKAWPRSPSHLPRGGHPRLAGFGVSHSDPTQAPQGDRCHALRSAPPGQVLAPKPLQLGPRPLAVCGSLPPRPTPTQIHRPSPATVPHRPRAAEQGCPPARRQKRRTRPPLGPRPYLTLFLCSESRPAPAAALPSELAFLSRFWKRSRAVRPRCELCLGTSSRPPKLSFPAALS